MIKSIDRKKFIRVGLLLIALLVAALIYTLVTQPFTAEQDGGNMTMLDPSQLSMSISENGKPINGIVVVDGGCSKKKIAVQGGIFTCDFIEPVPMGRTYHELKSIRLQSLSSKRNYEIPVRPTGGHTEPLKIRPNTTIRLFVAIDGTAVSLKEQIYNQAVPVGPTVGLTHNLVKE